MPKLIYKDPETDQESILQLDAHLHQMTIGRNPGNALRVNNPSISRRHAELTLDLQSGHVSIEDLGSSNGTYVNGTRILQPQMLQDGDRVRVGEFPLIFSNPPEAGAEPYRPATAMGGFGAPPAPPPGGPYVAEAFHPGHDMFEDPYGSPALSPGTEVPIYEDAASALDDMNIFAEEASPDPSVPYPMPRPVYPSGGYSGPVSLGSALSDAVDEMAQGVMDSGGFDEISAPSSGGYSNLPPAPFPPQDSAPRTRGQDVRLQQGELEELQQRVRELEQEKRELHEALEKGGGDGGGASHITLERTRKERDRLSDERRTLMRQIKDLKRELEESPDPEQLEQAEATVASQAEQIATLSSQISALQGTLLERDTQIDLQQGTLDTLTQGLWGIHEEHEEALGQVDAPEDVLGALGHRLLDLTQELGRRMATIAQLEETVEMLNQGSSNQMENLIARGEQIATLSSQVHELEQSLEHREERINHLLGTIETQQDDLLALRTQAQDLQQHLEARPQPHEVQHLQGELATLHQSFEALTKVRQELVQERDGLEDDLAATKQALEDIQRRFDSVGAELDSFKRERDELKQERVAFARETDYLQVERRRLSEERDQVTQKVQTLEQDKRRKKEIFDELKRDLQRIIKENTALQKSNASLQQALEGGPQPEEFEAMRRDKAALKEELDLTRTQLEDAEQEFGTLTRSLGEMAKARDALTAKLKEMEGPKAKQAQDVPAPPAPVDPAQVELLEALKQENAELKQTIEAFEAGENPAADAQAAQIQELEEALAALMEERERLEERVSALQES